MIVLDANILIRAILGKRVGHLLEEYSVHGVRFYEPDTAYSEAEEYLPVLLKKKGWSGPNVSVALRYLQRFIEPLDRESYVLLEEEARQRLQGRDGMKRIGLYLLLRSCCHARYGRKTEISLGQASLSGLRATLKFS